MWCRARYDGCSNEISMRQRRDTPACYILILSFLHHCLVGAKLPCCNPAVSTTSSHCTKPRKPSRASREPGEDLAKASRTHFSVSDLFVIGCRHGKEWLSGSSLLGQSRFGRRNYIWLCLGTNARVAVLLALTSSLSVAAGLMFGCQVGICLEICTLHLLACNLSL